MIRNTPYNKSGVTSVLEGFEKVVMEIKDWIQNRGYRRSTIEQVYHFCQEKKKKVGIVY